MALIVQKYGGTSVGTPERILAVANRIARTRNEGHDLIVVVSAMGDTTDDLIDLAHQITRNPPHREMDMLLSTGERISMALLSMALSELGVPAVSFTGSQTGIITDQSHRRARIKRILGDRVRGAIQDGKVAIIAGFQGMSEAKEITTLGRGGSDTTAVALAAALGAQVCEIYTDVDGVFTADPRIVPQARHLREISHDLMVEMATRGAGVLHPRSVELAKQFKVALCVRNSLNQNQGTNLVPKSESPGMEDVRITGVTADRSKMLLSIELARPTVLGAIWDRAKEAHLMILAPTFSDGRVHLFIERDAQEEWKKQLQDLSIQGFIQKFVLDESQVPLSVIGDRFAQDGTALAMITEVLSREQIFVTLGSASPLAVTVAIPETHAQEGVRALHQALIEGSK